MKNERKVCDEKKFECVIRVSIFLFLFTRIYVASTRSRLSQVRDKKEERSAEEDPGRGMQEGDERKERRKSMRKRRRSRESENRKEKRNRGPRNSLRSLPSGLVLARSLLLLSRLFFFFFSFLLPF